MDSDLEAAFAAAEAKRDQKHEWINDSMKDGDHFTIMVTEPVEVVEGKYGPYGILRGTDRAGNEIVFGVTRTVTQRKLMDENRPLAVGDVVSVLYLGKVTPEKGGSEYYDYKIGITRRGVPPPSLTPADLSALDSAADHTADALEKNIPTESVPWADV